MLHLILVRHGETEWNKERRYQGQADIPLSSTGKQQAKLVAKRLVEYKFDAIYASDLKRARQTASAITEKNNLTIISEPRLREMSFGVLEGLTWNEAQEQYPEVVTAWLNDYNQPPEGGESLEVFTARITSFLNELKQKHEGQIVLLTAHGGSLGEFLRLVLGLSSEGRWYFEMENASLSEILISKDFVSLKRLNETCHLISLKG